MKTTDNVSKFKPSTYCDNVREPLLQRITELEKELAALKKQVRTQKREKDPRHMQLATDAVRPCWMNNRNGDLKEAGSV